MSIECSLALAGKYAERMYRASGTGRLAREILTDALALLVTCQGIREAEIQAIAALAVCADLPRIRQRNFARLAHIAREQIRRQATS